MNIHRMRKNENLLNILLYGALVPSAIGGLAAGVCVGCVDGIASRKHV
jgi:hypothetical protein